MRAFTYEKYGSPDVLQLKEVAKPTPKETEVLVSVRAASLNAADWHLLRADPFLARMYTGWFKPKFPILGADIAGVVESVGTAVTQFKPGDEVFGDLSSSHFGGFAEYATAEENTLVLKPKNLTFEQAAAVPLASVTALLALRTGAIVAGDRVLINGASGGVGTFALQLAKSFGAVVTAVCSSSKVEMVRSLGADFVVDYTKENFTEQSARYDLIIGANGYHSLAEYKRVLTPTGRYVMTGGSTKQMFEVLLKGAFISKRGTQKMTNILSKPNQQDLQFIKEQIESGKVTPFIDRTYELAELPTALRYLEEGHARGKVVITMGYND